MTETPNNEPSSTRPPEPAGRSRRLFRRLLILALVVITPLAVVGYRWQQQMAFLEEMDSKRVLVTTIDTGPTWLRSLVGKENMRGFEKVAYVGITDPASDKMARLVRYQPSMVSISSYPPSLADQFDFGLLTDLKSLEISTYGAPNHSPQAGNELLHQLGRIEGLQELTIDYLTIDGDALDYLKNHQSLRSLAFPGSLNSGSGLQSLETLPELDSLIITGAPLTLQHCRHLGRLTQLHELGLGSTGIDDECLAQLKPMSRLTMISLYETKITDKGLRTLGAMNGLEEIDLTKTGITDEGLPALYGLKNLKTIFLFNTRVTPDGVSKLQAALPDCHVQY